MANVTAHPNSVVEVARRLDVGVKWIEQMLEVQSLMLSTRLTDAAVAYLEYCKNPYNKEPTTFPKGNLFVAEIASQMKQGFKATLATSPKHTRERVGTFLAPSIMYAKEIRISEVFRVETSTTQIAIKGKNGEYEPSTVLEFECGGLLYYCSSISVHPFGIKLHHVWGIFPA